MLSLNSTKTRSWSRLSEGELKTRSGFIRRICESDTLSSVCVDIRRFVVMCQGLQPFHSARTYALHRILPLLHRERNHNTSTFTHTISSPPTSPSRLPSVPINLPKHGSQPHTPLRE